MSNPAAIAAAPGHGGLKHRHTGLALAIISAAQLMVMLDLTIVNVALPSIQRTLGLSATGLEWVITAYVVTFGGLLLLGGRSGDLFGRRRMFVIGVLAFSLASLAGGLATSQTWLIAARVVQGAGAAIASPTALGLIAATFEDGPARHRAMAVYAAMSGAGGGLGLLAGGLLTEWVSWRWVLFVNVPIGALVAIGTLFVLDPGKGRPGRLDLPGAASVTAGAALLVYGFARAADFGWSNSVTVASLIGAGVLLLAFVLIETRSSQPLLPLRILASRNRSGGYAVMLLLGAAMLSLIFFMTQLFQDVLGYSPIIAGLAFLPMPIMVGTVSQAASRLVGRIGIRPLLIVGPLFVAGGLTWMSLVTAHSSYPAMLGPLVLAGIGMGLSFVPLTLNAVGGVRQEQSGLASGLLNTSQQIGGSLGLATLVAVAATVTRSTLASAARAGAAGGHVANGAAGHAAVIHHALVSGYDSAFRVGAGIAAAAFVVALATIRSRPAAPAAETGASEPVLAAAAVGG
ncbi:MAG: MFS transporter [Streptosporangiaceae bacterium]